MYVVGVHVCMMYFVCGACIKVCMLVNPSRDQRKELVVFLYGFAPRCLETETITECGGGSDLSVLLAITLSRVTHLCPHMLELLGCAAMPAF